MKAFGRMVILSNRLPVVLKETGEGRFKAFPGDGGLVTALTPVLRKSRGVWIGWPGVTGRAFRGGLREALDAAEAGMGVRFQPLHLDRAEVRGFYRGFSNELLWPLFHDLVTTCDFDSASAHWDVYQDVNARAASLVAAIAGPSDFIWVHDYHFLTVARALRRLGVENRLAFFLHTPFPAPDLFLRLPWRRQILGAVLEFDLVGFQCARDQKNFLDGVEALAAAAWDGESLDGVVRLRTGKGAPVRAGCFPISIDYASYRRLAESETVRRTVSRLASDLRGQRVLLGVDRLDYTKGVPQKIRGFRRALELHHELRGNVTLVQHVVPSRESNRRYRDLRLEIERLVGEVNGRFGTASWTPVRYFYSPLDPRELAAFYRLADALLVTSLKDGMNLVSKEYCASRCDGQGVLVLSEFAGAAAELAKGAILVNPHDREGLAHAIRRAVAMDPIERRRRMYLLASWIRAHDVFDWVSSFLRAARARPSLQAVPRSLPSGGRAEVVHLVSTDASHS
jgi:trehalose 6-phosphate synthase